MKTILFTIALILGIIFFAPVSKAEALAKSNYTVLKGGLFDGPKKTYKTNTSRRAHTCLNKSGCTPKITRKKHNCPANSY